MLENYTKSMACEIKFLSVFDLSFKPHILTVSLLTIAIQCTHAQWMPRPIPLRTALLHAFRCT